MLNQKIDKLNVSFYTILVILYLEVILLSISEQIKVLCVRSNISLAELARRIGVSP